MSFFRFRIGVAIGKFAGDLTDAGGQDFGFDDGGVGAPGKDPTFDFFEGAEAHFDVAAATGEFLDLLGLMPEAVAEHVGGPRVEFDDDFEVPCPFEHGEAAFEIFIEIEGAIGLEFITDKGGSTDSA